MAKEDRGFASMDRNKQREIASKGGKAAHQKGTAHEWTSEEAREAGRKGGMASHRRKQQQQQEPSSASENAPNQGGDEQMMGRRGHALTLPVPDAAAIINVSRRVIAPRLALGGHPTVGHVALDHGIGVRIPASQPLNLF